MSIPRRETPQEFVARLSGIPLEKLHKALLSLPTGPRQVLVHRFGLRSGRFLTLTEVTSDLGISRSWARRRIKEAMSRMREYCAALPLACAS
jgi:DNA-directed RNA polymerase sigma subunit (sigma70/sigma32)